MCRDGGGPAAPLCLAALPPHGTKRRQAGEGAPKALQDTRSIGGRIRWGSTGGAWAGIIERVRSLGAITKFRIQGASTITWT